MSSCVLEEQAGTPEEKGWQDDLSSILSCAGLSPGKAGP